MIIYSNRYTKKHVIRGSGIVDTIKNILRRAATGKASRSSLAILNKMASSDLGREAITAAKLAGKELASSAISTAKDVAIDKGKKAIVIINTITKTPNPNPTASDPILTKKSKDIISELVKSGVSSISNSGPYEPILGGSLRDLAKPATSVVKPATSVVKTATSVKKKVTKENPIRIQDLVKMGSGMMMRG